MNIKESAENYEIKETKNICELEKVSIDLDIREEIVNEGTPEEFSLNIVTIENKDYRIPNSVLKQLKVLLEDNKELKFFKVKKTGEGMKTSYQTIPLN